MIVGIPGELFVEYALEMKQRVRQTKDRPLIVAGYANDVDSAIKHDRTGTKPLVIKAFAAAGADNTDVVISASDAAKLRDTNKNLTFLTQGKVMIVID